MELKCILIKILKLVLLSTHFNEYIFVFSIFEQIICGINISFVIQSKIIVSSYPLYVELLIITADLNILLKKKHFLQNIFLYQLFSLVIH